MFDKENQTTSIEDIEVVYEYVNPNG